MPLQIIRQDITKMKVDAIVNTTNAEMIGYSGVDLAIHTAAGEDLDKECSTLPLLGHGQAQITKGYNLPCKFVIHTSGPIWEGGNHNESEILRSCYLESLKLAVASKCSSVAFPLISSGVYGYPKDQVLKFAVRTITEFLFDHELTVYICVFDKESYTFSKKLFSDIKAFIDDEYADESLDEFSDLLEKCEKRRPQAEEERKAQPLRPIFASYSVTEVPTSQKQKKTAKKSLRDYLDEKDQSFSEMLFELIDKSQMTDVECYKRANLDKRTFSKIKSNKGYKPSKQTVIAFAIALRLDLETTQALLATVGFTLSKSAVFDKIIRYFIINETYDIFEINEALFEFDQILLGAGTNS